MTADTVITIIQGTGFPIAACIGMGWYINKITDKVQQSLENNTAAIHKMIERMEMK